MAQELDTIFQIGKGGISENLIKTVSDALEARELVKLTVLENSGEEPRAVLDALCSARGEVVERKYLSELLGASDGNIADVYICRLRKKLEGRLNRKLIFAERGRGYKTILTIKK